MMAARVLFVQAVLFGCVTSADLRLGAFNIQIFGTTKIGKTHVTELLTQIVRRYDLVLVQEFRDSSGTVIPNFLSMLNADGNEYNVTFSERLGRSSSKEQYAYYYRKAKLQLTGTFQYDDSVADIYQREPYAARFTSPGTEVKDFALIGVHTAPDDAETEISHLVQVYEAVTAEWNVQNVFLLGDFNADCSYVTRSEWPDVNLRHDARFTWLIGDDADTTVSSTDCAYDRIVTAGQGLLNGIVTNSTTVFRYDTYYSLDDTTAREVSDHYPVELLLKGSLDDGDMNGDGSNDGNNDGDDDGLNGCPSLSCSLVLFYACFFLIN